MTDRAFTTDEARFKDGITEGETMVGGKAVRVSFVPADWLDWYYKRGTITPEQHRAGLAFQQDYEIAISGASVTCAYERREPSRGGPQEHQMRATQRWRRATEYLGPVGTNCAVRVICEGMNAGDWAHSQGRKPEYGIERLRECLDTLADAYA